MPTYAELLEVLNANDIRRFSHYIKSKLVDLILKKGWICENGVLLNKKKRKRIYIPNIIFIIIG